MCAAFRSQASALGLRLALQARGVLDNFARILGFEHHGAVTRQRVILTGPARLGDTAGRHRLETDQAKRFK